MSSDSSSSGEEFERLKEAVDGNFLPQDLYRDGNLKEKDEDSPKPSLRNQSHQTTLINPFAMKVTPEFQRHVSKHLSRLLDETIDDTEIVLKKKRKSQKGNLNSGVKLLSSSKDYMTLADSRKAYVNKKNFYRRKYLDKIDFEERAREVAVSPDWVLSKEEVRHWAPTKGEIEIVKLHCSHNKLNF